MLLIQRCRRIKTQTYVFPKTMIIMIFYFLCKFFVNGSLRNLKFIITIQVELVKRNPKIFRYASAIFEKCACYGCKRGLNMI